MAERFQNGGSGGSSLLQLELREQGGLLNPLGVERIEAIINVIQERLMVALPEGSSICRSRPDRLIALMPGPRTLPRLRQDGLRLQTLLSAPIQLGDELITPVLSLGLSRSPQDGVGFELLLEASDRALAKAHRQPIASACVASPPERPERQLRLLARPLARAIHQQKLRLYYQPIVEMESERIEAVEVLCRWDDPVLGRISPIDFIAVAEATEQINQLGRWLIDTVFGQVKPWLSRPGGLRYASLNISPLQLHHGGLVAVLQEALARHDLRPGQIMLEITEDQSLTSCDLAQQHLLALHRLGFQLAMDDYGTGYSGLQRLHSLPFTALKVDRSLIKAVDTDTLQQAMIRGVMAMQNNSNLTVVVEGIERQEQRDTLLALGCRYGQGFLFARPIPPEAVDLLLPAA